MSSKISEEDKVEARQLIRVAFELCNLTSGEKYVCPACNEVHRSALNLRVKNGVGTWKCFKTDSGGDAIGLVMETFGYSFVNAVQFLLGRPVQDNQGKKVYPKKVDRSKPIEEAPTSVVDNELYGFIVNYSGDAGREAAAKYYSYWHIAPEATWESGATKVLNMEGLHRELVAQFGIERLKACGVMTKNSKGEDMFLINSGYPVIEPHITPNGFISGMQFRPDGAQRRKVEAHIAWSKLPPAEKEKAVKVPYKPKFTSLAGVNGAESLVGFGLPRLATLPPGANIRVVEGFKDYLAARTMGHESYGIPGVSAAMNPRVLDMLRNFRVDVCLDGDEAGIQAQGRLVEFYRSQGIQAQPMAMPPGKDVADILVDKFVQSGCQDAICVQKRAG